MFCRFFQLIIFLFGFIFYSIRVFSQNDLAKSSSEKQTISYPQSKLFNNEEILHFKLTGKLNALYNDRNKNIAYHPLLLQYERKDSAVVFIQIKAKARGNFRRLKENCKMPPIMLNFPIVDKLKNTVFENQHKLKLVVPCQGDEYVIREWLVYKLYNLITEKSFRAALVQVDFEDSSGQRKPETHYCILLEDENKVAERNKASLVNQKMLKMESMNKTEFTKMAVFQYMIANTDWGVSYLQNIKLLSKDSVKPPYAIPYDFDHAGIVDAPYAGAAPELEIASIQERIYRGYCETDISFIEAFEVFNRLKNDIYNVYTNCSLLNPKYVKFVTRFLNDFYKTINNDKSIEAEFKKPCRTNVRIELKGLKD